MRKALTRKQSWRQCRARRPCCKTTSIPPRTVTSFSVPFRSSQIVSLVSSRSRLSSTLDLLASQKDLRVCRITFKSMSEDPVLFRFYTGASVVTFARIRAVFQESPQDMDYTGSKKGEPSGRGTHHGYPRKLSLWMIKLRNHFPESDLGNRFAVSQSTVSRIFSTWILCLF